ncbi:YdcH family protein [Sphingomonas sp. BN140010]|uniref:YdcH family protein n=1 Tax=Sphingomonas arvum TaxID=2992113 RepID=A0ABT3JGG0_9SPHN|nr:YdcH family protein [Sphingomonas sp. BN140010]MCW3798019.1 YdcH family protein [Sphingomonas sp. BN140010]
MHPRMYRLIEAHSRIDHALREEQRRRRPDDVRLTRLKKLKLRVKDLMHRLARKHAPA